MLVGLAIGLLGGIAIAVTRNATLLTLADVFAPLGTLWINAVRMTVIPLVDRRC